MASSPSAFSCPISCRFKIADFQQPASVDSTFRQAPSHARISIASSRTPTEPSESSRSANGPLGAALETFGATRPSLVKSVVPNLLATAPASRPAVLPNGLGSKAASKASRQGHRAARTARQRRRAEHSPWFRHVPTWHGELGAPTLHRSACGGYLPLFQTRVACTFGWPVITS
jgi:hypothetical protein